VSISIAWGMALVSKAYDDLLKTTLKERDVSMEEHVIKHRNLLTLAREGYRIVRMIEHDKYWVKGKDKYFNPYTQKWSGRNDHYINRRGELCVKTQ
jgi:hypothetical protein